MKNEILVETFRLTRIDKDQRQKILDRFFTIHQKIFSGANYNKLRKEILETRAEDITLTLFKKDNYDDVGFCILYRYTIIYEGRSLTVFRSDAGLLPKYRHNLSTLSIGLSYILKYKLCHPFKEMIYFECYVHPSSYHLLHKYYSLVYPSPILEMPEKYKNVISHLRQYFSLKPALSGSEFCAFSDWVTIEHDQ